MSASNHVFQNAFKLMPTPAFILHKVSGNILEHNQTFADVFAKQACELPNNWLSLSQSTQDLEQWQAFSQTMQSGQASRCHDTLSLGEKEVETELHFQDLDDEHFLVCLYSAEQLDLASTENSLLKLALSESSSGLWVWDIETDTVECSQSLCDLIGCSVQSSPKSTATWHCLVHPEDLANLKQIVEQHIADSTKNYEASYRILQGNGNYLWVKERGLIYAVNSDNSIAKTVGFIEDISSQKKLEKHLRRQATFDDLTGLLTHSAATTHFKKQLGLAKRQYTPLTMVKINLNADGALSQMIYEEKNQIIKMAAKDLYRNIREGDILARVASDKLLLLLPNTNVRDAKQMLDEAINSVHSLNFNKEDGGVHSLAICAGVATFPEDGETIEELAESANNAVEAYDNNDTILELK